MIMHTLFIDDNDSTNHLIVGRKASNLSTLYKLGFNVPDGFSITIYLCQYFYELFTEHNLKLLKSSLSNTNFVKFEDLGKKLDPTLLLKFKNAYHKLIKRQSFFQDNSESSVVVRSSSVFEDNSTDSHAGLYLTELNIKNFDDLIVSILKCYFHFFCINSDIKSYELSSSETFTHDYLSLFIQILIPADCSGVIFTEHPSYPGQNQMIVNSNWGLCESIVSGKTEPDEFTIDKKSLKLISKTIGNKISQSIPRTPMGVELVPISKKKQFKPSITKKLLTNLVKCALKIEEQFSFPQDVEWSIYSNNIFILQSRPISTLKQNLNDSQVSWSLSNKKANFARISICDSWLPEAVSPLFSDTLFPSIVDGWLKGWLGSKTIKFFKPLLPNPTYTVINGYPYFGISFNFAKYPLRTILMVVNALRLYSQSKKKWKDHIFHNYLFQVNQIKSNLDSEQNSIHLLEYAELIDYLIGQYWGVIGGLALHWNFWESTLNKYCALLNLLFLKENPISVANITKGFHTSSSKTEIELDQITSQLLKLPSFKEFISHIDLSRLNDTLYRNKIFKALLCFDKILINKYLEKYDHLIYNLDFSQQTFADNTSGFIYSIYNISLNNHSDNTIATNNISRKQELKRILSSLNHVPLISNIFFYIYRNYRAYYILRDKVSFFFPYGIPVLRSIYLKIGLILERQGWIEKCDDIFYLNKTEILSILNSIEHNSDSSCLIKKQIVERKSKHNDQRKLIPPSRLPLSAKLKLWGLDLSSIALMKKDVYKSSRVLKGSAVSPGVVCGSICVVRSVDDFHKMTSDQILVVPFTTPAWSQLFPFAKALITDTGGMLSHGSIIAREHGIPAVMGTESATRVLVDGQIVTVDGYKGLIYL